MKTIKVNDTPTLEMEKGFLVGLNKENLNIAAVGTLTLDESLEIIYTLLSHTLRTFDYETNHSLTEKIYDKAVEGFSLMIDKFHQVIPSNLDQERALLELENEILQGK